MLPTLEKCGESLSLLLHPNHKPMTRETIIITLGIVVALSPWSGLPPAWHTVLLVLVGASLALLGWTLRD
jgi:hypothetical protein